MLIVENAEEFKENLEFLLDARDEAVGGGDGVSRRTHKTEMETGIE